MKTTLTSREIFRYQAPPPRPRLHDNVIYTHILHTNIYYTNFYRPYAHIMYYLNLFYWWSDIESDRIGYNSYVCKFREGKKLSSLDFTRKNSVIVPKENKFLMVFHSGIIGIRASMNNFLVIYLIFFYILQIWYTFRLYFKKIIQLNFIENVLLILGSNNIFLRIRLNDIKYTNQFFRFIINYWKRSLLNIFFRQNSPYSTSYSKENSFSYEYR